MFDNINVSIVIPCYNHGEFIDEAVNSVLASTYSNIEIIIVNDGSTDNFTNNLLQNYNKPKTRVVFQSNKGVSEARNSGIAVANGKYILPLDGDDKIHPEYIEKAVKIFEQQPEVGLVYCWAELFGTETGFWKLDSYKFETLLNSNCIFVSALYRKSDWEKVGGYKSEMKKGLEDWEFFISLTETGVIVYQIPEVLFYYRKHHDSRTSSINKKVEIDLYKQIIKLHAQLYMNNIDHVYPLFRAIFKDRLKREYSLLRWFFSITPKQEHKLLKIFGFKFKIKNRV